MHLGYYLQDERKEAKMSVEKLAELSSLSPGSIRAYEQGRRTPSAKSWKALEAHLEFQGQWLSSTAWQDGEGEIHHFAHSGGGHPRQIHHLTGNEVAAIRLELIRTILTADIQTLHAINLLTSK